MNNFQGFDNQNNGAKITGTLAGTLTGIGTFIGFENVWWRLGWGPWAWSVPSGSSATLHAYWLAIAGHIYPTYKGDFKNHPTWFSFESWLRNVHQYDAFMASFWIPLIVSIIAGILVGVRVVRAINRKDAAYVRGGQIK